MHLNPKQKIGAYRIVRPLGQGGMGAVYEVEHEQLGVRYALKAFTCESGHADILKKKFLAEGKVLARLRHPNLIRVFDLAIDEATGLPYFVMDIVTDGTGTPRTLGDLKNDDLNEECLVQWFEDLCQALDYIHGEGIVHRDIKLGNVLLREDGHVMLSDFGVSRIFDADLSRALDVTRTLVTDGPTASRLVMGTAGYLAPEIRRGEIATPAADAYALGVLFFQLLTGLWYEPGTRAMALLDHFNGNWRQVLELLLAPRPEERPQQLADLPRQLKSAAEDHSIQERRERGLRPSRRARRSATVILLAAVLLSAAVAILVFRSKSKATPTSVSADFRQMFSARDIFHPSASEAK